MFMHHCRVPIMIKTLTSKENNNKNKIKLWYKQNGKKLRKKNPVFVTEVKQALQWAKKMHR